MGCDRSHIPNVHPWHCSKTPASCSTCAGVPASGTTLLLTSFAVSAILRVVFQNLISARPIPVSIPSSLSGVVTIGPLHLGMIQLISIIVTLAMLLGLNLFLHRTMAGRAMRAALLGEELA